jgi:hypothetical protein
MRRTAKVKAAAVAATAIAAAGQAGVAAAQATLPAAGPCRPAGVAVVTWRNGHSGRYLTVRNASGANGAEIQTTSAVPNRNRLQECWLMDPSGSRNGAQLYGMINEHSFKCADYFGRLFQGGDIDQGTCGTPGHAFPYRWEEHPIVNRHGVFLGAYSLIPGGGTASNPGHLCENRTHGVYIAQSFPAFGSHTATNCRWR